MLKSKTAAWLAMLIVIIVIAFTMPYRQAWWIFIDIFFAFMMVFSQLASLYIEKLNKYAAKKLRTCAAVFLILWFFSLIGEYIAFLSR